MRAVRPSLFSMRQIKIRKCAATPRRELKYHNDDVNTLNGISAVDNNQVNSVQIHVHECYDMLINA